MTSSEVVEYCSIFMKTEYFKKISSMYIPLMIYIGGSYSICDDQHDIDLCIITDQECKGPNDMPLCYQFFFKHNEEITHIDIFILPINHLLEFEGRIHSMAIKSYYNFDKRVLYINPKITKTYEYLNSDSFRSQLLELMLVTSYDTCTIAIIYATIKNNFSRINKALYCLYYAYCEHSGQPINIDILLTLKESIKYKKSGFSEDIIKLLKIMGNYVCSIPLNTIKCRDDLNDNIYNKYLEDMND